MSYLILLRNTVEREGISLRHPAKFVLVGSGNPEEGELRPQLLDRFGLHEEIRTERNPVSRVNVVLKRITFDKDPLKYLFKNAEQLAGLKKKISHARDLLGEASIEFYNSKHVMRLKTASNSYSSLIQISDIQIQSRQTFS